jgi:hypothetical protein
MKCSRLTLAAMLLLLVPGTSRTQSLNTSQISGTIADQTGAALPNAEVKLTQTDTGMVRTVMTNAQGQYVAPDLPLGPYMIEVHAPGFKAYVTKGVTLQVGTNPDISAKLETGAVTETVTVETLSTAQVETETNGIGQVIDQRQVVDLPLNGRDPTQLIALAGATTTAPAGDLNTNKNFPSITLSVAGGLPNGVAYVMDGGMHNDLFNNLNLPIPFPDALQEFKVETNSLPAQYGDHATAAVNVITKGGSNQFHGDVFEFVRNYIFNAANFFGYNSATGVKVRDNLKRNQFGGVIGGPIVKNKLFFFGGFQETITRSTQAPTAVYVPTPAMMTGDFTTIASATCQGTALTLPAPFVGNKINPALFNQQALNAIAAGIPVSNGNTGTLGCGQINVYLSNNSTQQQAIGRVDYTINPSQSVFARYYIARFNSPVTVTGGNLLQANQVNQFNQDQSITIGHTYSITPRIINSIRLTGNRTLGQRTLYPFFDPSSLGINDYTTPADKGFMGIAITNGFSLGQGGNNPGYFNTTDYQLVDDVNIVRGNHQISFGGNYFYAYMNSVNGRPVNGTFSFAGTLYGAGKLGYADFLLGTQTSTGTTFTQGNPDLENDVYHYVGAYGQDSWKVRRNLTINYGLRWEPYIPFYNRNSHAEHFSMADFTAGRISTVYPLAPAGLTFAGDTGFTGRSYNAGTLNIFEPRVGVIWDPTGTGKMSLRAGYGKFYDTPQMFFDTRFSNAPPFGQTVSLNGNVPFTNPWSVYPGDPQTPAGQDPFPALSHLSAATPFVTGGTYINMPANLNPEYLQQYNVSLQQQVGNYLFSITYLGNKTSHLPISYEANPGVYGPGATTGNTQARRVLSLLNPAQGKYYATIGQYDDAGTANYNGLLASLQTHTRTIDLVANYTWAHCLSMAETTELTGPSYIIPPAYDPNGRNYSYSNCDSDRRQVVNVSSVLHAPKFEGRFTNLVVGGWGLGTIFTARSGGFGTVTSGSDNALSGISNQLAVITGNPYSGARTRFGANNNLVASAFSSPATGTYALTRPLTIVGPASYELDMALLRDFHTWEQQYLQFRWEVFNVPNEAIFLSSATGGTNAQVGARNSSTFGNFTTADNPRIMQFALKYVF